ncbi:hypothetical protein ACH4OY_13705 [Micromonospora rubida]|uniref:Phage baseplate protein n=1 Tax=Micromonospora rubida TaxID=2697657 RepID=A0ABW7SJ63_9ACTN
MSGPVGLEPSAVLAAWERGNDSDPVRRALALLAMAHTADDRDDLDLGSRDVLLARLLVDVGGELVWARADCGSCAATLDVPVDVAAVARLPVHPPGARFATTVPGGEVTFRLPTTGDLIAVRELSPAQARAALLTRCLRPDDDDAGGVDPDTAEAVEAAMDRIAPAGAVELLLGCPVCGTQTVTGLDVAVLLWAEIEAYAAGLIDDVHALASAYGWTETQVLALSPARRAAYLERAVP